MRFTRLLCVLLGAVLTACATSPTGRTQLMVVSEQSAIAASRQAYTEMLDPLAREGRLNTDADLNRRVGAIADDVIAEAVKMRPDTRNWDWNLMIIDDPKTVNAWAMAGGKMALYTGLVERVKPTADELAQVLAHEIAHALARHSAEKMSVAAATNVGVQTTRRRDRVARRDAGNRHARGRRVVASEQPRDGDGSRSNRDRARGTGRLRPERRGVGYGTRWRASAAAPRRPFLSTHPHPAARKEALKALVPAMLPLYEQARAQSPRR